MFGFGNSPEEGKSFWEKRDCERVPRGRTGISELKRGGGVGVCGWSIVWRWIRGLA